MLILATLERSLNADSLICFRNANVINFPVVFFFQMISNPHGLKFNSFTQRHSGDIKRERTLRI